MGQGFIEALLLVGADLVALDLRHRLRVLLRQHLRPQELSLLKVEVLLEGSRSVTLERDFEGSSSKQGLVLHQTVDELGALRVRLPELLFPAQELPILLMVPFELRCLISWYHYFLVALGDPVSSSDYLSWKV